MTFKENIIPWNKGLENPYSKETLKKMSDSHRGKIPWNKGKRGHLSEETLKKISMGGKGRACSWKGKTHKEFWGKIKAETMRQINSEKHKGKPVWNKGLTQKNDKRVKKNAESIKITHNRRGKTLEEFYGKIQAKKIRKKVSKGVKQKYSDYDDFRNHQKSLIPIRAKKASITLKKRYREDLVFRERLIKQAIKNSNVRPTSIEKRFMEIVKKNKLPYKYVGDGSLLIGFKNPDFVNNNGQKVVVEVYCPYFKEMGWGTCQEYEKQRSKHFAKFGFKTVFFEGKELKDEKEVLEKLQNY